MIVDSAHYKDGVRQHDEALTPERAAELRRDAASGEFVWIGIHEPEAGDLERLQKLRESGALTDSEFEREKAKVLAEG